MSVTIRGPSPRQLIVIAVVVIVFMALAFWYLLGANDLTGNCNQKAVVSVTIAPTPALIQHIKGNPAKLGFGLAIAGNGLGRPSTTFARPDLFLLPGPAAAQLGHVEAPIPVPPPMS